MQEVTLRIAHDADFPPLTFVDGAESRRLVIDLLKEIPHRAGLSPVFVPIAHADHEEALRNGAADAIAFKGIVPEFTAVFDFSAPILISGGAWFRQKGDSANGPGLPEGARVVTPGRGPMLGVLQRNHPHLELAAVDSYADALAAVADGAANAAALNFHIGGYLSRRDHPDRIAVPSVPFAPQPIAFCVLKGQHQDLLSAFDRALETALGEGLRKRLETQWLGEAGD